MGVGSVAAPELAAHGRSDGGRTDLPLPGRGSGDPNSAGSVINQGDVHLGPLIEQLNDLTDEERAGAASLIHQYGDVFSKHEFDLGCTPLLRHRIDTGTARPLRQGLRRHPQAYLDVIDERVESMLRAGIIEPSSSAWASNVVLVQKADPTAAPRITIDYRSLNLVTYKDAYPIPHIGACLDALQGCSYFSTLDLSSGFFQVPLHPDDAEKTPLSPGAACSNFAS